MNHLIAQHLILGDVRYQLHRRSEESAHLPYLVFLHGFLGTGAVYSPLIKILSRVCNPILIDLAGHGGTDFPQKAQRYHLTHQLNDLLRLIHTLDQHKILLYGYSMGGRLALQFAVRHPQLLQGLILESTSSGIEGFGELRKRLHVDHERAQEIMQNYPEFLERWNRLPMFKGGQPDAQQYAHYMEIQRLQQPINIANSLIGFSAALMPDIKPLLRALPIPVCLLAGEYDPTYVHHSERLRQDIPESTMHVVSKAAHRVHLDRPDAVTEVLLRVIPSLA